MKPKLINSVEDFMWSADYCFLCLFFLEVSLFNYLWSCCVVWK